MLDDMIPLPMPLITPPVTRMYFMDDELCDYLKETMTRLIASNISF